jgi:hypothetical protein
MTSALLYRLVQVLRSTTELKGHVAILVDEMTAKNYLIKTETMLQSWSRTKQSSDGNHTPNDNIRQLKYLSYHMETAGIGSVIVKWRKWKGEKEKFLAVQNID